MLEIVQTAARNPLLAVAVGLAVGLLASVVSLQAFAELADDVPEGETLRFDGTVLLRIHAASPDWLEEPMRLVTALGYYWVVIPLLFVATYALYLKGLKFSAAMLIISTAGSTILAMVLKAAFQRARPELFESGYTASFYSFPSGHATVAIDFYGTRVLLAAWWLRGFSRWAAVLVGAALIVLIGFSRLYLGVHYPTDIAAGYLAACLWVSTVGTALFFWRSLRKLRQGKPGARNA